MSVQAGTLLAVASPSSWLSRYYAGIFVAVTTPLGRLSVTQNHPVLSHAGWVPARGLVAGAWVVACDHAEATTAREQHEAAPGERRSEKVWRREFWGDGDRHAATVVGPVARPLVGEEGTAPPVDPWPTLAALSTPVEFGCSTWAQACLKVPGLDRVWCDGAPDTRGSGIGLRTRLRLGDAFDALPAPPVDREALSEALTGLVGTLRLVPVTRVEGSVGGGEVHDILGPAHCVVAGGIVVG